MHNILSGSALKAQISETIYQGTVIDNGYLNSLPLDSTGPYNIGFNFTFFEASYTQFYVTAKGLVMFTAPASNYSTESDIPNTAAPNNYIAPFWDDLTLSDQSGNILYSFGINLHSKFKCFL